jgi:predicted RNase H-like nuclease (RuvC/YqgF family)
MNGEARDHVVEAFESKIKDLELNLARKDEKIRTLEAELANLKSQLEERVHNEPIAVQPEVSETKVIGAQNPSDVESMETT